MVLAGALLVLMMAGAYSLWSMSGTSRWTKHTDQLWLGISRLLTTLTNAESGARGYVVAGMPEFLGDYEQASTSWRPQLAALRDLTEDNVTQETRLDQLELAIARCIELLAEVRTAYEHGERGADLSLRMGEARRAMDDARSIFAALEAEEARLDEDRRAGELQQWRITFVLFGAGVIAFLIMLGIAYVQRRDAIARRLRADETARAQALFRIVLEGADLGITVQDVTGALVYANAAAASIIGFDSPAALLAAPSRQVMERFEIFYPDGTPFPPDALPSRAALRGETTGEISIRFRNRGTRDLRWTLLRSVPARDAAGAVVYSINFLREVTEAVRRNDQRAFLLRAVDELNSSLDYEHTLATMTRMAVPDLADWCAVDIREGDQVKRVAMAHVDPAKLAFVEELERRYPSDPDAVTGVPQIIRSGKSEFISEIPHELIQAAATDDEHLKLIDSLQLRSYIGVPLTVRDHTIGAMTFAMAESDRRYRETDREFAEALADRAALAIDNARLFRELERANAATNVLLESEQKRRGDAEQASRFADMFIGILGHDLRNPLNAVSMAAHLLRQRGGSDPKTLGRIESSSRRMTAMVAQLLDLARSRLGDGITVSRAPHDLAAITANVVDELRLIHPDREIVLETTAAIGAWDQDRLSQVISNLAGNAVEHGEPARPVTIRLANEGDDVRLSVHNHGRAIPEDLLPTLFDPYRRITARGAGSKGLGLGLFITQQIVLAHGGCITVESDERAGTTFVVVLPRKVAVLAAAAQRAGVPSRV